MIGLVVEPEDGGTDLLGKLASELQEDIRVNEQSITGSLNYVTGYTGFDSDPDLQKGNFLALKFSHPEGYTTTVEIVGGFSGPVTLDSDMNWVGRIANNEQKVKVVSTKTNSPTITNIYDLHGLILEEA